MEIFYVYEHWRSDTNECFYVGKGALGRLKFTERKHNKHHSNIVAKLKRIGGEVDVRIVGNCLSEDEAFSLERSRIAHWRSVGDELVNLTDGGEGLSNPHHDVRAKMSAARKGKPLSEQHRANINASRTPEVRAKISAANTGRKRSPETCARIGAATKGKNLGKKASAETRAKMSAAQKGKIVSPESRAKIAAAHTGLSYGPLSEAHKAKIGAKSKGRKASPETIAKMRAKALGRSPQSDEVRASIRAKVKALWADPEYRKRMSDAHKGYVPTDEAKANMRAGQAKRGPRSDEHCARISASIKQRHAERRAQSNIGI